LKILEAGSVQVYLAHPDDIDLTHENLLDATERSRADAFKFFKDRKLYVAAHIFLRKKLSRHGSFAPSAWRFNTNRYGKPAIANSNNEELYFNLSHTQNLIACAISYQREVGIDVEKRRSLDDFKSLCHHVFSTPEVTDILSYDNIHAQEQRFFTYWTLKEAYIKARGMGLSIPLKLFTFTEKKNGNWYLHCDPTLKDSGKNWQFFTDVINEHHLSIGLSVDSNMKASMTLTFQASRSLLETRM
jgi:4'-phosphopantetheinyl transferase